MSEELNDQELFDEAVATEPVAEAPPKEEAEAKEETKAERERDEKGRFVPKEGKEPSAEEVVSANVEAPTPIETPKEERPDHRIPLTELLNEREKRQRAEQERAAIQQQYYQMQQQLQAMQQPQEPIDIFANPEAYTQSIEQTMSSRLRAMEGNFSLRLASYKHGDTFQEAWQEMVGRTQAGDDSIRQQVLQSPDPGETLVQLYQREKVVKEVGPDPTAYRNKVREDALNDPEFLAKALEKARGVAGTQSTQKIHLPPSLNKVAASHSGDNDDASDRGVYSYATR
jgi:hypothetical protein